MIYQISQDYFLRPLKAEDLNGPYSTWFEDQEVCKYNAHGKFFKDRAYFEGYLGDLGQEDRVVLAICHSTDGHIGNTSLQEISMINRSAEFAILLGDKRHWGKRVGALAAKALIKHGFQKLNLERVYCGTAETNIGMRKLAQELGMVEEGRRRKHLFLDGSMVDMVEYGLLRTEFEQSTD
jgi:[ribosomal protein S5]-alanine N-acetyltransferase